MIRWTFFPKNQKLTPLGMEIIDVFNDQFENISSKANNERIGIGNTEANSNNVLEKVSKGLIKIGFDVEVGKKLNEKIKVPVLYGEQGKPQQSFDADAYHKEGRFVLEVEAGRAVTNYQFLKDYFQACVMVDVEYVAIAVRDYYRTQRDYETICNFFETLYASGRIKSSLKGVLIIGY